MRLGLGLGFGLSLPLHLALEELGGDGGCARADDGGEGEEQDAKLLAPVDERVLQDRLAPERLQLQEVEVLAPEVVVLHARRRLVATAWR